MKDSLNEYIRLIAQQNKSFEEIPSHYYGEYNVKRGLRNPDGTGVLAGLTGVGEVHVYVLDEGNKAPIEGSLRYRGISIQDIVKACMEEDRYGFEEVIFLLIFGYLPNNEELKRFVSEKKNAGVYGRRY